MTLGIAEIRRAILTEAERKAKAKLRSGDGAGRQAMMAALKAQIALEEEAEGAAGGTQDTSNSADNSTSNSPRLPDGSGSPGASPAILHALNDDEEGLATELDGEKQPHEDEGDDEEEEKGNTVFLFLHTPFYACSMAHCHLFN